MAWFNETPEKFGFGKKKKKKNRRTKKPGQSFTILDAAVGANALPGTAVPQISGLVLAGAAIILLFFGVRAGARLVGRSLFSENSRYAISEMSQVKVETDGILPEKQIRLYAGIEVGTNIFSFDLEETRKRLESYAIIRKAKIHRTISGVVSIEVFEREGIARLGPDTEKYQMIVDLDGYVIRKSPNSGNLPVIRGLNPNGIKVGGNISESLAKDALVAIREGEVLRDHLTITGITVGHKDHLSIFLKSEHQLVVPRDRIGSSLVRAARVIKTNEEKNITDLIHIDLRPPRDAIIRKIN